MTIGVALLILWVVVLIINIAAFIDGEEQSDSRGILATILRLAVIAVQIWFIIGFWNTPF